MNVKRNLEINTICWLLVVRLVFLPPWRFFHDRYRVMEVDTYSHDLSMELIREVSTFQRGGIEYVYVPLSLSAIEEFSRGSPSMNAR